MEGCPWTEGMAVCRLSYEVSRVLEHVGNWGSGMLPVPCLLSTADMPLDRLVDLLFTFEQSSSTMSRLPIPLAIRFDRQLHLEWGHVHLMVQECLLMPP
jgi:hypothetical protein